MSTRGLFGVVIDGEVKAAYNHSDSYPSWLGKRMVEQVTDMLDRWGIEDMRKHARNLVLVDESTAPTADQIETLKGFSNLGVGNQTDDDWYCLLRELQGDLTDTLTVGYMIDGNDFAKDGLFCEWGYLVNLDDGVLEVYKGFRQDPHTDGRFADLDGSSGYAPIALIATYPFDDLPKDIEFLEGEDED